MICSFIYYIFLCFGIFFFNITEAAEAIDTQRKALIVIGSCLTTPECNKKCNDQGFPRGKCFEAEQGAVEKACGCYS